MRNSKRKNIKIDDEQRNKELPKKMVNPFYFTDRALQVKFKTTLDSHDSRRANSIVTSIPNFSAIEIRYVDNKF